MNKTDIKETLISYLGTKNANAVFARYKELGYPHLRDRYVWFLSTGNVKEAVPVDLIFDSKVKKRAKKGDDLKRDAAAHRNVLLVLEIEAEKLTALRFANAFFSGNYVALGDIFRFHDKNGRYLALWKQFAHEDQPEPESGASL